MIRGNESEGDMLDLRRPPRRPSAQVLFEALQERRYQPSPLVLPQPAVERVAAQDRSARAVRRRLQPLRLRQEPGGTGLAPRRSRPQVVLTGFAVALESQRERNPLGGRQVHRALRELPCRGAPSAVQRAFAGPNEETRLMAGFFFDAHWGIAPCFNRCRGSCAAARSGWDDAACAGPWLRSGGCARG
jgi:hypothetical protein